MPHNITVRGLLEAGIHFGHRTRYWNPKMAPYIFGVRQGLHIINLEKMLPLFEEALSVVEKVATKRGKILFVGTKYVASHTIQEEATRCGMPHVNHRWLGGMLTNYKVIRKSIKHLADLEEKIAGDYLIGLTKKEGLMLVRERDKLHRSLSGIKDMGGLPDLIFIIDVGEEKIALQEAKKLKIPVMGIVDTNNTPEGVDYVVPGNDDSIRGIRVYVQAVADTIIGAHKRANAMSEPKAERKPQTRVVKKVTATKTKIVTKKTVPLTPVLR